MTVNYKLKLALFENDFEALSRRLLDPGWCCKFAYLMTNSADPDQFASFFQKPPDLDLNYLQKQGIYGFSSAWFKRQF